MTIGKRLLLLLAVPLIALLGFGIFARTQLAHIEERSRFVSESQLDAVAGLGNTAHTIKVVATGAHSSQSGGAWVWVDAFNVTP